MGVPLDRYPAPPPGAAPAMSSSLNPYSSPATDLQSVPLASEADPSAPLAGRFTRYVAVLVDGLLFWLFYGPYYLLGGALERQMQQRATVFDEITAAVAAVVVFLIFNGYLLATRGQSIGKWLTGIRIVDHQSGKLLSFRRVYVYRYLWSLPLIILTLIIPGEIDSYVVGGLMTIDAILIFGADRRCLHDRFAGSIVQKVRSGV